MLQFPLSASLNRALSVALLLSASACGPSRTLTTDSGTGVDAARGCTRNEDCNDNTPCTRDLCLVGGVCENTADNTMCPMGQTCISGRGCTSGSTRTCMSASECDDRIPCTRDTCLVDGTCRNQPDDTMCMMGQRCDAMRGCGATSGRCTMNSECNDMIDCTEDTCTVAGTCEHVPQNSRCTGGRTCNAMMGCIMASACRNNAECDDRVYCNGEERCNTELACVAGTPVNCADMDPCTIDACNESTRMCTHTMDMACMGSMVRSGIYDLAPVPMFMCASGGVNFNIRFVQITSSPTGITVTGAPATMMGPPVSMMRFRATGTVAGSCPEEYTLEGMFTSANEFTGTFSARFIGGFCFPTITGCTDRMWSVTGTYRM